MIYQYKIGCSLENLKGVRDFVRKSLRSTVLSDVVLNEIILALDEMCSNLMIHAHQCNPDHVLEVHIETQSQGQLIFEIMDEELEWPALSPALHLLFVKCRFHR